MDKIEKERCEQILDLLQDMIALKEDFYYTYLDDIGYVFLQYVNLDGTIEQSLLLKSAVRIFNFLMNDWKYDYVNKYMENQNIESFNYENVLNHLPTEIIEEMNALEYKYIIGAKEILQ